MAERRGSWGDQMGMGCAFLFLTPFAAVGIGASCLIVWQIWSYCQARSWVERPCHILQVKLKVNHDSEGTTYKVIANYQYEFDNRPYSNDRIWFGFGGDNIGKFQQRTYAELKEHFDQRRPYRCYVDPKDPSSSVLCRELRYEIIFFALLFVLIFGGFGVGGLCGLVYTAWKIRRMNAMRQVYPHEPWKWDGSQGDGTLRPRAAWIAYVLTAVIWNLASWIFTVAFMNDQWLLPSPAWIILLFPLVGLFIAWMAMRGVYHRLRYGAPTLTISPWPLFVGAPFEGKIEFPFERPSSSKLIVELTVKRASKSDSETESDITLFTEKTTIPNSDAVCHFRLYSIVDLPRTSLLNDEPNEPTAEWTLKVTGENGPWDFEAIYPLRVFKRTR